ENKIAFLTSLKKDPGFIARNLMDAGVVGFRFCVLENIGYTQHQKITWFDAYTDVMAASFSHPNMVILLKNGNMVTNVSHETPGIRSEKRLGTPNVGTNISHEIHPGMDDTRFHHVNGLITKSEIRSICLSRLKLVKNDHVLWDIGSGSGSISIEAALSIPRGKVFAIEKNKDRTGDITHNIKKFTCSNVQVMPLDFPDGIETMPPPDRIFVGGGGKNLGAVLDAACEHLMETGIIVINTVVIQNMERAFTCLEQKQFAPKMVQVQISRSRAMPFGTRLASLNPVWIIFGTKPTS
ncbi:MAG: precorrin-6Y C5,15-methyltransferase (decarboxylating) subunit CbiT, partial [Desulfobacteraceae bacterium]|nr:precorrin-6Y C5,15-methyltransferase (decarboxylating) subunit CbiT [Desulfobacteraceae bacterium]